MPSTLQLTILMPCLNEAETLATCIRKARGSLDKLGLEGEVLVADNGSTDGSIEIAQREGARVVPVSVKGYGSALRAGIAAARGEWIIMGDADDSYDFSDLGAFVDLLAAGNDLVMGCRMPRGGGRIMPGAMPWKHRWIGNPVLTAVGRLFFRCPAQDFHCGLRGMRAAAIRALDLQTEGMEFASEMVIKATFRRLKIVQVPITLYPDGRSRAPHLRSWRDGWRHLRFMLLYSPRWLFLVPGLVLSAVGGGVMLLLGWRGSLQLGGVRLDVGTMMIAAALLLAGFQSVAFAVCAKIFAIGEGLLPSDRRLEKWLRWCRLETGLAAGALLLAGGFGLTASAVWHWSHAGFGDLAYAQNLRRLIPAGTLIALGAQVVLTSFFLSLLGLRTIRRTPPGGGNEPR